jgi:hypothetical protein
VCTKNIEFDPFIKPHNVTQVSFLIIFQLNHKNKDEMLQSRQNQRGGIENDEIIDEEVVYEEPKSA